MPRLRSNETLLSHDELLRALRYEPDTGLFYRRESRGCKKAGSPSGWKVTRGYVCVGVGAMQFTAHRLAWLYMTGAWPLGVIDHINGDTSDNRWANLRDVPHAVNCENQRNARRSNASGYLGVTMFKGRPRASIRVKRKLLHLGTFDTVEQAHEAYLAAKRRLHEGCTI